MKRAINREPDATARFFLALLPFLLLLGAYMTGSALRLAENPQDKLLPGLDSMVQAMTPLMAEIDPRSGDVLFWTDTGASLARLLAGLLAATALSLAIGVAVGLVPYVRAGLAPLIAALSMMPPLAVLPILFIVFGLGELSKVVLIVIGITPVMARDLALRVAELPREQIIKAQTLGAGSWQIALRVVLPQTWPRLIDAVRLSLGAAWLFLIAAEAIASQSGLGYRIFLLRRYLAMDAILPYVAWITLLAWAGDYGLRRLQMRLFPWFVQGRGAA